MDALSDLLEPYSDAIGKVAGTITTLQFLSGAALINDIRKKGCSDVYPVGPFLGGIVLCVLSIKLGMIMGDQTMLKVNVIGFAISSIYMVGFYYYASSENKTKLWSKIGYVTLFLLACIAYANFEDPAQIEFRLGMLITSILIWLVGSPLLAIPKIIEKKCTEGMPFPIIFAGQLVSTAWMLYAISIRNNVMVFQNLFLWILGAVQLSMFALYPNTPAPKSPAAKKAGKKDSKKDK
ncbi:CG7272 [Drosophila busckii]|uniref:Sugar transporter SWEET n=1 Tax=Drosophila busckii TaxID=30019 RepID=A0A0M3QWF3_DROBS|nr:sugar transporter SWEET1 [Drosophila busckii]ALC44049.1 CG7272 [Drosophila busckii]